MVLNQDDINTLRKLNCTDRNAAIEKMNEILDKRKGWKNKDIRYLVLVDFRNKIMLMTDEEYREMMEV